MRLWDCKDQGRRGLGLLALWGVAACGSPPAGESAARPAASPERVTAAERPMREARAASDDLSPGRRHAVVLVIDTLRADAVAQAHTPNLDALAAEGQAVERAWSPGTWTVPSVIALFTGMTVRQHGWNLPSARIGRYPKLPETPLLAEVLHREGFATHGLYANPYLAESLGFDRGFDEWRRIGDAQSPQALKEVVATWGDGRRHFVYVHLLGPHSPLRPSEAAAQRWDVDPAWLDGARGLEIGRPKRNRKEGVREAYRAAYHAVVEDTDARVGELLEVLAPHRSDTALVVVSDHGELLGEHNRVGHGRHVYEPLTHVPWIAVGGDPLPRSASTAGVAAWVTQALGVEHTWPSLPEHPVSQREEQLAILVDGHLKGTWETDGTLTVVDVNADPGELQPLTDPALRRRVEAERREWEARTPAGEVAALEAVLPESTQAELQALGYVDKR